MKVSHERNPRTDRVHPQPSPAAQHKTSTSESRKPKEDEVIISPRAAEVRKLTEMAKDLPDVRKGKVEAIKKQIQSGEYKVSAESVAKSIIDFDLRMHGKDTS